jgi:hypothetical protein
MAHVVLLNAVLQDAYTRWPRCRSQSSAVTEGRQVETGSHQYVQHLPLPPLLTMCKVAVTANARPEQMDLVRNLVGLRHCSL